MLAERADGQTVAAVFSFLNKQAFFRACCRPAAAAGPLVQIAARAEAKINLPAGRSNIENAALVLSGSLVALARMRPLSFSPPL